MDASSFNVNVLREKPRIVNLLKMKGPCVAPAIAKELNLNSFLASALLSELIHDNLIKTSALRVGGGPLYYIAGQEEMIENFIQHLPSKEREAFQLLKKEQVLEDSKMEPAIRVALRMIKDFAVPLKVALDSSEKIFWRFHTFGQEEAQKRIGFILSPEPEKKGMQEAKEESIEKRAEESEKPKKERAVKERKGDFDSLLGKWMAESKVSAHEMAKEGKSAKGRISFSSDIGMLEYLMIAKDKKSINETDIIMAHQDSMDAKMPALLLTNGKLTKKAEEMLKGFKNVVLRKI